MDIPSTRPSKLLVVSNAIGYVVLVAVNVAAGTGLFGPDNGTISKQFATPLTPSGWAFSIWGFIFLLQGIGTIYALLPNGYTADGGKQRVINAIGYRWQLGWYSQVAWQLFFVRQDVPGMWACLAFLLAALASFASALRRLYTIKDEFVQPGGTAALLYAWYLLPTTVNAAWLSVASCLGGLVLARAYGVAAAQLLVPSILLAALVTVAGTWIVYQTRDTAYGLTLVWALMAVYGKKPQPAAMRWTAFAGILVMSVVTIGSVLRRKAPPQPPRSEMREPLRPGRLSS